MSEVRFSEDGRTAYVDIEVRWPPPTDRTPPPVPPNDFDTALADVARIVAMLPEAVERLKAQVLDLHRAAK